MARTFTKFNTTIAVINLVVWVGFTWLGFDLVQSVVAQHLQGYPNQGQIAYYIRFPIIMALLTLGAYLVAYFTRYGGLALSLQITLLLTFFPFAIFYTGGV